MQGWLMYERAETVRNRAFIDYWLEAAQARCIELQLVCLDEIGYGLRANRPWLCLRGQEACPDFAVMRLRQPLLSCHLESMGVRVFNSARTSEILNDKRRTHTLFREIAPMMDTAFISGDMPCPFAYPVVVKGAGGCGGRQVCLCGDEAAYRAAIAAYGFDAVVQPLCDTPGRDLRIYMLGTQSVQTMLRKSDDSDFRSNFGLHHLAEPVETPPELLRVARTVAEMLGSALIGVDFIRHQGRYMLNEAEDAVGTRMLYRYTRFDIVPMYLDYILSHMR